MTDLLSHGARREVPELILILHHERPIPADDFGALFSAFAADYSRLNRGRTLVVAGLERGSIIAHLQEAYAVVAPYAQTAWVAVEAANNLKKFMDKLRDLFGKAKEDPHKVGLFQRKRSPPGIKSVEAILKIASDSGAELDLHYIRRGEEEISLRFTPKEAIEIRERAKIAARELSPPPGQRRAGSDTLAVDAAVPSLFDAGHLADRFLAAGKDAEALIKAVASVFREAGMGHGLEAVAAELDERGHHALANAVRAHSHHGNRASEPPART